MHSVSINRCPTYISQLVQPVSSSSRRQGLRSSSSAKYVVASLAVDQFSRCLNLINDLQRWMSKSRSAPSQPNQNTSPLAGTHCKVSCCRLRGRSSSVKCQFWILHAVTVVDTARSLGRKPSHESRCRLMSPLSAVLLFQVLQIRLVARALSVDAARTLVQAFISCRLDYCNSLLCGVTDNSASMSAVGAKCSSSARYRRPTS